MNKEIENIMQFVDATEKDINDRARNRQATIRTLEEEIKALRKSLETIHDFEELKKAKATIKENEEHLQFLIEQRTKPEGAAITEEQRRDFISVIDAEAHTIQADAAPEIQKLLFAAIDLMDKYTAEVGDLSGLKNRVHTLRNPNAVFGGDYYAKIGDINPDICGWWHAFVNMYYSNADTAAAKKAGNKKDVWGRH